VAAKVGPKTEHLNFLRAAKEDVRRYGFFALIRAAEARAPPGTPRVGQARLPSQNIADMAHAPVLHFPGSTLNDIEFGPTGRARVRGQFLGLTGPMDPCRST